MAKFRALSSDDKIYCLSYSMKFLSQFASHCRLDNMNDYLKFSVLFLANAVDQRAEQNPEQYSSHFSFADSPCCEH